MSRDCNLLYITKCPGREPNQAMRTLWPQEPMSRGVIAPSFVVSYSHADEDIDRTLEAIGAALAVYRRALAGGAE